MKEKTPLTPEQIALKRAKRKRAAKKIFKISVIVLLVLVALFFVYNKFLKKEDTAPKGTTYTIATAARRSIVEELSGSGTLESAASYTLSTRVGGEILSDTFAEGDIVKKGDVLYVLDSSDMDTNLENAQKNLKNAQETYNEKVEDRASLTVTAPISGVVSGLNLSAGDSVNKNASVLTIKNTSVLTLTEYYSTEYQNDIYVGKGATVSIPAQMLNLGARVSEVSSLTRNSETGVTCFAVTIEVENPGSLNIGTSATAWIDGGIYPTITADTGLEPSAVKVVRTGTSGDVEKVSVSNGDFVKAGMTLIKIDGEALEDEIEKAKESLDNARNSLDKVYENMDSYTVTAPIDGTVIRKNKKAGENAEGGDTLCMIYDLSYLTVTLAVDELDISKVEVGQNATVTADAASGKKFDGVVTRVGVNGTTSGGVTTYPVDIRIDEIDGLLPGMNADIVIAVREAINVVTIPVDAIERNNRVLVKKGSGTTATTEATGKPEGMQMPEGMQVPEGFSGMSGAGTGTGASRAPMAQTSTVTVESGALPEGYEYVTVEIGMSNENYVEIISGIEEGDSVAYISKSITTQSGGFGAMGGFGGMGQMGGMSGARPSGNMGSFGGMSGARPSGNMGGMSSNRTGSMGGGIR